MKIVYITAGAAGMYCGSCMRDNTLVAALIARGHDALLVPTYTPIRTDEEDVSLGRVFYGGINVFLQQKSGLFRKTPWLLDSIWDAPDLLRWVSRFAVKTRPEELGDLTLSMLRGRDGRQRKELAKLVHWLTTAVRPEVVNLSNSMLLGMAAAIKQALGAPIVCTLQGDDIFLEGLPEPYRREALDLIREQVPVIDRFIASSRFYADFMADYLAIDRERIDVVWPGLDLRGHGAGTPQPRPHGPTIGYLARICPEKGFHELAEAFQILCGTPEGAQCRFRAAGYLGDRDRPFFEEIRARIASWGLADRFEYLGELDRAAKIAFFGSIDVHSVPTVYREPKGLSVLESLANGVPVVQPRHGSFPELIEATGGGLLVEPEDPAALAEGLRRLISDDGLRAELGRAGKAAVHRHFTAGRMAREVLEVYQGLIPRAAPAVAATSSP